MNPLLALLATTLGPIIEPILEHWIMDRIPTAFKPLIPMLVSLGGWTLGGLQQGLTPAQIGALAATTAAAAIVKHDYAPSTSTQSSLMKQKAGQLPQV